MTSRAFVVVGLQNGDEGKGSVVDWLTREHGGSLVCRFNGGAQAAHHVVLTDGREHTFRQFGSGTLAGARTYLSEDVLVNPLMLAVEAAELMDLGVDDPLSLVSVHADAPITTPYHVALNRLRELSRGDGRHGSCGLGIGETMVDVLAGDHLRFGDLRRPGWVRKLNRIAEEKYHQARALAPTADARETTRWGEEYAMFLSGNALEETIATYEIIGRAVTVVDDPPDDETVIFEGAQGVLLDQDLGFPPYHTWSRTTSFGAHHRVLRDQDDLEVTTLGVVRAYATRHGRGPLPTEARDVATPDASNARNPWQEDFRQGWPDLPLVRFASLLEPWLDELVVTCLDKIAAPAGVIPVAHSYRDYRPRVRDTAGMMAAVPEYEWRSSETLPRLLADAAGVPLYAVSRGPTAAEKERVREEARR